jgi:hypothetical protein
MYVTYLNLGVIFFMYYIPQSFFSEYVPLNFKRFLLGVLISPVRARASSPHGRLKQRRLSATITGYISLKAR